jgi:hypothetical protein
MFFRADNKIVSYIYVRDWGQIQPVIVAVDLGNGQPIAVGQVNEKDNQAVRKFLEVLVQRLGVSGMVTDGLSSYHPVAEKLGREHQVCQIHLRHWVGRTLHELYETVPKEWQKTVENAGSHGGWI